MKKILFCFSPRIQIFEGKNQNSPKNILVTIAGGFRKRLRKNLLYCLLLLLSMKGYNQQTPVSLDTLAGNFIKSIRKNPIEKIYLHTDKWFYVAGETAWFNAFCVNALSKKPIHQSNTLFVDLVDQYDNTIDQILLNLKEQGLHGRFALSHSLPEGYYWIRAYTRKILHEDSNRIFVQPIYVLNPQSPNNKQLTEKTAGIKNDSSTAGKPQLVFYPEGGSIVSGTNAVVAFRALDANGKPVNISGYVTDSFDSVVTNFKTVIPGFGKFNFDAWKARKYIVHVKWPDSSKTVHSLPSIDPYASQISVIAQTSSVFQVQISLGDSLYQKNKSTYLLGISGDSLCFASVGTDMYQVYIPKEKFPPGKATLILFDDQQKIVSERNIYNDKSNSLISVEPDKEKYGPREKVNLNISITDHAHQPEISLMSIAVTDDNLVKSGFIQNDTLLPSFVNLEMTQEQKNYSGEEWDLMMLTQKDQYLGWKPGINIPVTDNRKMIQEDYFTAIHGHIENKKNERIPNRVITLVSNEKNLTVFENDTTDATGDFYFPLPAYEDSTQFIVQVANKNGVKQDEEIVIDSFSFPHFHTPVQLKKRFSAHETKVIHDFKTHQLDTALIGTGKEWLNAVTVKGYKKKEVDYDESKRVSQFSRVITNDMINQGGMNAISNALLMTPGVHLKNGRLAVTGGSGFREGEPLLVVDGVPMNLSADTMPLAVGISKSPVLNFLDQQIPTGIVDFIEVLTGAEAAIYGTRGAYGVILVNTGAKMRVDNKYAKIGLVNIYPKGYFKSTSFVSPDYDKKEIKKSISLDERSTIYWNGEVLTDNNGKANIGFFTSDPSTTYTVTLTGFTSRGEMINKQIKINRN